MTQKSYENQPPDFTVKCHSTQTQGHSLIILLILSGTVRKHKRFIYQRKAKGPNTVTHCGPDAIVGVFIPLNLRTTQTESHGKLIRKTCCLWSVLGKRDVTSRRHPHPKVFIKTSSKCQMSFRDFRKTNTGRFFSSVSRTSETKQHRWPSYISSHSAGKISAAQNSMVSRLCGITENRYTP